MKAYAKLTYFMIFLVVIYLTGCVTGPTVAPTIREINIAKEFKKTVAVLAFTDDGSPIGGVNTVALSKLENILTGRFNLVERERIEQVLAERHFASADEVERATDLGKLLGADYLIFGNAIVSVTDPVIQHSSYVTKEGEFRGRIWEAMSAYANVSVRMVDVNTGIVHYTDKQDGSYTRKYGQESFTDNALFKERLKNRMPMGSCPIMGNMARFSRIDAQLVSASLDNAVSRLKYGIRKQFSHSGEVLELLSPKEVLVNLGSAFGVRAGDRLVFWEEKPSIIDPRTGTEIIQKEKRYKLRVMRVNSGLSCVARGSKKTISLLRIGSKVYTY